MEKVKFYPQVSTNGNTIKYLMEDTTSKWGHFMLPKNDQVVEKNGFRY